MEKIIEIINDYINDIFQITENDIKNTTKTSKTLLYIVDSKKPKNDENVFGIEFVGNEVKEQWFRNQK